MDSGERVRELQKEIKQLSDANEAYRKRHFRTSQDSYANMMREQRLKQIIDELARIADPKKP